MFDELRLMEMRRRHESSLKAAGLSDDDIAQVALICTNQVKNIQNFAQQFPDMTPQKANDIERAIGTILRDLIHFAADQAEESGTR